MRVDLGELVLLLVLLQTRDAKPASILVGIFPGIVPSTLEPPGQMRPDQFHRFLDRIHRIEILARNAVFGFKPEQMHGDSHQMI